MHSLMLRGIAAVSFACALPVCFAGDPSLSMFRGGPEHTGAYTGSLSAVRLKWAFQTHGKVRSSAALAGGVVCFGSEDGHIYAVDAGSGRLRWQYATEGDVSATPAIAGSTVYAVGGDGHLLALALADGKLLWRYQTGPQQRFEMIAGDPRTWDWFRSSPTVTDTTVYFGSGDTYVYAIDRASGKLRWRYQTGNVIRTSPAVSGGVVYIGGFDGYLYALDAGTGKLRWKFKTEGNAFFPAGEIQSSPAVADGKVFFGARDGFLYALDTGTGKQLWRSDHKGSWVPTSPAVANGLVFAGSSDAKFVQALDINTGTEKWRYTTKNRVFSSPAATATQLWIADGGELVSLNIADGKGDTKTQAEVTINSSPVIAGDILYVGSDDSRMYAFQESPVTNYTAVKVDPSAIDQRTGTYLLGTDFKIALARDGDHLNATLGGGTLPFEARSATHYFNKERDMEITFASDGTATFGQGGYTFKLKKIE